MAKNYRSGRLSEEIRRIVSNMLLTEIKDPRLAGRMVSVTGVDVTSDGSYATCYISVLAPTEEKEAGDTGENWTQDINREVLEGLKSASGKMRGEIGRQIKIRHTPELIFKVDESLAYGRRIEQVIKELEKEHE